MNHCPLGPRRCQACKNQRYGAAHQARRRWWRPQVAAGHVLCARCGDYIAPGQTWHLDHLDDGSSHPSHATCNSGDGGRNARARDGQRGLARGSAGY